MPANLSPEYIRVEREYRAARSPEEKLVHLETMLRVIPKHKGTDHMQADLKQRLARLRQTVESRTKKKGPSYRVRPEGAGQLMLAGPPNSGKSSLLAALTHAHPEIAAYPCTTHEPLPGMVDHAKIQYQLVDLPPVWREHCESFVFENIKASDGVVVVVDLAADDPPGDYADTVELLKEKRAELVPTGQRPEEPVSGKDILEHIVALTKIDIDDDGSLTALVEESLETDTPVIPVSVESGAGLDSLKAAMFDMLHVIRIFTKEPGKEPDMEAPYTVPIGATVQDLAACVHLEFAENLKSARVWGSAKFDGQAVSHDHVLADADIVELSMR